MKLKSLEELQKIMPDQGAKEPESPKLEMGHHGKGKTVHVSIEKKGRKGKIVTIVSGLQHNPATMQDVARILKVYCGAGGTVKEGVIEIQGEQRVKVSEKLRGMHYIVK